MKDDFSNKVHWFLKEIRKQNMSIEDREELYNIMMKLESRTEKQKRRFALYYGLVVNNDKKLSFTEIAKLDNCSVVAIRTSVVRVRSKIPFIKGVEKEKILKMIKDMGGENI